MTCGEDKRTVFNYSSADRIRGRHWMSNYLRQNRIFSSLPLCASGGIRTQGPGHLYNRQDNLPVVWPSQRCLSRPNRSSRSGSKCKSQTTCRVPLTSAKGGPPSPPTKERTPMVALAIGPPAQSLSGIRPLVWPAGLAD